MVVPHLSVASMMLQIAAVILLNKIVVDDIRLFFVVLFTCWRSKWLGDDLFTLLCVFK
jgi:hypothetical protein